MSQQHGDIECRRRLGYAAFVIRNRDRFDGVSPFYGEGEGN
jgi:hypothetical protein